MHYTTKSAAVPKQRYIKVLTVFDAEISIYTTESAAVPKQRYTNTYCSNAEISTYTTESDAVPKQRYTSILTAVVLK